MRTGELRDKYIQISPAVRGKKKTNREICVLFDTMYSPAFPPTQADLHNTPTHEPWNSPHTDGFSWHILCLCFVLWCAVHLFVMSLIRLRAFSFFKLKKRKITAVDNCQVLCSSHHKTNTTSVLIIQPNLPHYVQEKSWKNITLSPLSLYPSSLLFLSASLHPWILLSKSSHRLHHMHLFQ